jgi:hypothetical protein
MSRQPYLLVFEYEIADERAADVFTQAVDMLRNALAAIPPLAQPFNVTAFVGSGADEAARKLFERDCVPPGQTVEGRSGEAP